jgi:hypothetical protein
MKTKIILLFSVVVLGLLGLAKFSLAANYYLNPDASCSGNACDGTSWAQAWKCFNSSTCSHSIDWPGLANADNTLYISGGPAGRTYSDLVRLAHNTSASRLTIKPGSASPSPAGHDGLVVIASRIITGTDGSNSPTWSMPNILP